MAHHIVFGWLVDTVRLTIKVPPHRVECLLAILAFIEPTQKRIQIVKWHQLLGELLGIPGAIGRFSVLQKVFRNQTDNRIRLSPSVHAFLNDFRWLVLDAASRPTRLAEILPQAPTCHCSSPCCRQYQRTLYHLRVTAALHVAVSIKGPGVAFLPKYIRASALRAGGAMALLCALVDTYMIQLLGRWCSDVMLCYLHV
jgi:hypothetical protein